MIPRASAIRCVSQRLKKQLINEFGVKEEKITVAPIFSNIKSKILNLPAGEAGLKSKKLESNDKFIFLTVGRLVPVKILVCKLRLYPKWRKIIRILNFG